MKKDYILENNTIGRYVSGDLSETEAEEFELAFFHDSELAALVEAEQALQNEFGLSEGQRSTGRPPEASVWARWALAATIAGAFGLLPLLYFGTLSEGDYRISADHAASATTYRLFAERGTMPSTAVPISGDSTAAVVFEIPITTDTYDALRITLTYGGDESVWTAEWRDQERPPGHLFLEAAASALKPGVYELTVIGVSGDVSSIDGSYRFRTYVTDLAPEGRVQDN